MLSKDVSVKTGGLRFKRSWVHGLAEDLSNVCFCGAGEDESLECMLCKA